MAAAASTRPAVRPTCVRCVGDSSSVRTVIPSQCVHIMTSGECATRPRLGAAPSQVGRLLRGLPRRRRCACESSHTTYLLSGVPRTWLSEWEPQIVLVLELTLLYGVESVHLRVGPCAGPEVSLGWREPQEVPRVIALEERCQANGQLEGCDHGCLPSPPLISRGARCDLDRAGG